jgi:hypothetical protein
MQKDNQKLILDLPTLFLGTPLEKFIRALLSGQFYPPPDYPVEKNAEIIDELNDFEKALYTAMEQTAQEHNNWVRQNMSRAEFTLEEKSTSAIGQVTHKVLEDLLWVSIKYRIGVAAYREKHSLSINDGYKIMLTPLPPDDNDSSDSLKSVVESIINGEMDSPNVKIHIVDHYPDCADCPKRQGCDSPIKTH